MTHLERIKIFATTLRDGEQSPGCSMNLAEKIRLAREVDDYRLTVDLERREVRDCHGFSAAFVIDEFRRQCLLEGLDDIGLTLKHDPLIRRFEARRPVWMENSSAPAAVAE